MIYRVTVNTTGSIQPGSGTHWTRKTIYCGDDRTEARIAYLASGA